MTDNIQWRCFHCDEIFTDREQACVHFGKSQLQKPACQIDVVEFRRTEDLMQLYAHEDTDLHREIHRLHAAHHTALQREEEKGYARGLKDGMELVAPGWKIVPAEPTQAMLAAVAGNIRPHPARPDKWNERHAALYKAMLAAAPCPVPEAGHEQKVVVRILFDGKPPHLGKYVGALTADGRSTIPGNVIERDDGRCELVIRAPQASRAAIAKAEQEPTEEMIEEGADAYWTWRNETDQAPPNKVERHVGEAVRRIYKAMIAVAHPSPTPPSQEVAQEPIKSLSASVATGLHYDDSAPFPNCKFKHCDLPGLCRSEGKCHHPIGGRA
jgi:hypothetical protein